MTSGQLVQPQLHGEAERHLTKVEPVFRKLIRKIGPCTLRPFPDHFQILVRTIVSQQISTKAADAIGRRLEQALGGSIAAGQFERLSDDDLRACGLSRGKLRSLRDLCRRTLDGTLALTRFAELTDADIRAQLLEVHGIGPWSADMFMMFSLGRPDVLPVGDLGFRVAVKDLFGLRVIPAPGKLEKLAAPWRPFRSIATWYCWRSRDGVSQS